MANVMGKQKREQIVALGRLGWSLRRIEAETAGHPRRRDGSPDLNRERLPREVIHDVERSEGPSIGQRVGHEVDRPALVGARRHSHGLTRSRRNLLPPSSPYGEGFFSVNAIDALAVDAPALAAKHVVDPAALSAWMSSD
jgi:hypothetical protein